MWAEYVFKVDVERCYFMENYHELYCNMNNHPVVSFVN